MRLATIPVKVVFEFVQDIGVFVLSFSVYNVTKALNKLFLALSCVEIRLAIR
jgi:hypothetical protein